MNPFRLTLKPYEVAALRMQNTGSPMGADDLDVWCGGLPSTFYPGATSCPPGTVGVRTTRNGVSGMACCVLPVAGKTPQAPSRSQVPKRTALATRGNTLSRPYRYQNRVENLNKPAISHAQQGGGVAPVLPEISSLCSWWCQNKPVSQGPGEGESRLQCYLRCLRTLQSYKSSTKTPARPTSVPARPGVSVASRAYRYMP